MPAIQTKLSFYAYRLSTILKSFKTLYTLPQEKVDAFLNSYNIYNHDWANEEELIRDMGPDYYNQVQKKLVDYYSVLNHLCAIGQVEKMYIPPIMDMSKGIIANQTLFEKKMASDLNVKEGGNILDIGCGRGRIASHIATETKAHVTGMNIDTNQLEAAKRFATGKNLTKQTNFIQGDLNKLPLPFKDETLDAVYQVQVFSYSKDLEKLFADIYRVLKPGGRVACLDWFQLDKYDPKNPEHTDLMRRIKPLIGAIGTPLIEDFTRAMEKAGFKILINENASINGLQAPLIEKADTLFTWAARLIKGCVKCRILPRHFQKLFDRLTLDGEAFVEADRKGLVTTCHYILAQKP
jgi:sterol 24-C-methyltransferase